MDRETLTQISDQYLRFARTVGAAIALSRTWAERSGVSRQIAQRQTRLVGRAVSSRFTDALEDCQRILRYTSSIFEDLELLSFVSEARSRMEFEREVAGDALREMRAVASAIASSRTLASADLSEIAALSDKQVDGLLQAIEQLGSEAEPANVCRNLAFQIDRRVSALHCLIILNLAKRRGGTTRPSQAPLDNDSSASLTANLRDSLRRHMSRLDGPVRPLWFVELANSISTFESLWISDVAPTVVELGRRAATGGQTAISLPDARAAAISYDNARRGLAYLSAAYSLLLSWSTGDSKAMTRWSRAAPLPATSDSLDLPRTDVDEAASGRLGTGTEIEVAGLVTFSTVERTGGRSRTVIRLDDRLTIYVPFGAIGKFGVVPGVWCQARGTLLDEGKAGFEPPYCGSGDANSATQAAEALLTTWNMKDAYSSPDFVGDGI